MARGHGTMLKRVLQFGWRLLVEEDGPTAVEYAIMLLLVFLACIAAIQVLGDGTSDSFTDSKDSIVDSIQNAQP
jgi:pilus assembly protein Flp/PilA